METIKTRGSGDIHGLSDIYHRFSAYRGLGRDPEVLIEDVRAWRSRRAKAAMEKRKLICCLLEEVQDEALRRKVRQSVHKKMEKVLEKPIPKVSAGTFRAFALRRARAVAYRQNTFEEKGFIGPRGYSDCGRADMWAEEIETLRIQALEYRRGALYLQKRT